MVVVQPLLARESFNIDPLRRRICDVVIVMFRSSNFER